MHESANDELVVWGPVVWDSTFELVVWDSTFESLISEKKIDGGYATCILGSRQFCLGPIFKTWIPSTVQGNAKKHPQIFLTGNSPLESSNGLEGCTRLVPEKFTSLEGLGTMLHDIFVFGGSATWCFSHRPFEGVKIYFQLWGWTKQPPPRTWATKKPSTGCLIGILVSLFHGLWKNHHITG